MEINGETDDGNVTDTSSYYTCTTDDEVALQKQYEQVLDYTTQVVIKSVPEYDFTTQVVIKLGPDYSYII